MNTSFIGRQLHTFETIDSTNRHAIELARREFVEDGTVILSQEQTAGRGYGSNSWESEKNRNLTFTIILKPDFLPVQKQFFLSMVISLGIYDFLILFNENISIKWPNDIYAGDGKIAGILIENILKTDRIEHTFAGIGVNINQEVFRSDAPNPVSLKKINGIDYDLQECLGLLCSKIEARYLQLVSGKETLIKTLYTQNLYRINETHCFSAGDRFFEGRIKGIDEFGHLLIEADGKTVKFGFKEVSFKI